MAVVTMNTFRRDQAVWVRGANGWRRAFVLSADKVDVSVRLCGTRDVKRVPVADVAHVTGEGAPK